MKTPLRLTAAAKRDVFKARAWYLEEAPAVADEFRDDLRTLMVRIEEIPTLYPVVHREVRRGNLARFPYAVFYRVRLEEIQVIAVMHQARDPRRWLGRR